MTERLAVAWQASLLARFRTPRVWPKPLSARAYRAEGGPNLRDPSRRRGPAPDRRTRHSPARWRLMPLRVVVIGGGIAGRVCRLSPCLVRCRGHTPRTGSDARVPLHRALGSALFRELRGGSQPALTRASRSFFDNPPAGLVDHMLLAKRGALWVGRPDQSESLDELLDEGTRRAAAPPDGWSPTRRSRWFRSCDRNWLAGGGVGAGGARHGRGGDPPGICSWTASGRGGDRHFLSGVVALNEAEVVGPSGPMAVSFEADVIVNAAGAWCDQVGALAGAMPIGLQPMRRTAFTVPGNEAWSGWPLVSNADNEFYFRPDGSQLLCSLAEENPTDPGDARPEQLDIALAIDRINTHTTLDIRVVRSSWTGLRSFVSRPGDGDRLRPGGSAILLAGRSGWNWHPDRPGRRGVDCSPHHNGEPPSTTCSNLAWTSRLCRQRGSTLSPDFADCERFPPSAPEAGRRQFFPEIRSSSRRRTGR